MLAMVVNASLIVVSKKNRDQALSMMVWDDADWARFYAYARHTPVTIQAHGSDVDIRAVTQPLRHRQLPNLAMSDTRIVFTTEMTANLPGTIRLASTSGLSSFVIAITAMGRIRRE